LIPTNFEQKMKPLTNDPRTTVPQTGNSLEWALDQQQQLLQDLTGELTGKPSSSSTGSNSPPFSMASTSPLELRDSPNRHNNSYNNVHLVGGHRRQNSASRNQPSSGDSYPPYSQSTTPRSRSFDPRVGHPYAYPLTVSASGLHGYAPRRRRTPQSDIMSQEERLESLWSAYGVGGSSHLGAGLTTQMESTNLSGDDWHGDFPSSVPFDGDIDASYYDHFTVDPRLRQPFDVHQPFMDSLFRSQDDHLHGMDSVMIDEINEPPEDSPANSEENRDTTLEVSSARRSTSADSNTTAAPATSQTKVEDDKEEEDKDAAADDGEQDGDDKTQTNKPSANNFVNKLHTMISDPGAADFIWWTELGTSAGEFSRSILGQHFKHNNVMSPSCTPLMEKLFLTIPKTPRNQKGVQPDAQKWEFSHPKFLRGRQDLLDDIKRKPVEPDPASARQRVELPSEVAAKLRQMSEEHEEVVKALHVERTRVAQLATIVKVLYDRLSLSAPRKQNAMDISGDSLVPSRNPSASSIGALRGRLPPAQPPTSTRNGRRTRSDLEGNMSNIANNPSIASAYRQDSSQGNATTVINNLAFGGQSLNQESASMLPLSGQTRNEISAFIR
ncbi:9794_t:CDS:2, partial [Acaulospora colombiana]